MKPSDTHISFIMPVKNGIDFLPVIRKDIESNLGSDDEIIIVNDNSLDGTGPYLKSWAKNQSQLRVIDSSGDGIVDALNLGLAKANNDWIARFDVDDRYHPMRIEKQRTHITKSAVAIFSDYEVIDEMGTSYGKISSPILPNPTSLSLLQSNRTAHSSVIFNKNAVIDVGGYIKSDFPAEDLSLWLRLSKVGDLITVPELLLKYVIRKGSVTNQKRAAALGKKNELIQKIGISNSYLTNCIEEFEDTINSYDEFDLSRQRKVLLLRDVLTANDQLSSNLVIKLKTIQKALKMLSHFENLIEVKRLKNQQSKRDLLRKSL
jgi:glycosyltransferase involved in cell wall biosynthesis